MDRNKELEAGIAGHRVSLSARRAWIEMLGVKSASKEIIVALRKESVDRNVDCGLCLLLHGGRSPQGERG